MVDPTQRPALGKVQRGHPLEDEPAAEPASQPAGQPASRPEPERPAGVPAADDPVVTHSHRAPASLRKRMQLAKIETGLELQDQYVQAMDAWLSERGL